MEALTRIAILANPGHFRDSLIALLRTMPHVDLYVVDSNEGSSNAGDAPKASSNIILIDLQSILALPTFSNDVAGLFTTIRSNWPEARSIVLVDSLQHTWEVQRLGADCVLPRSVSAGEFLTAVRGLDSLGYSYQKSKRVIPGMELQSSALAN